MTPIELAVQSLLVALQAFLVAAGSLAVVTFTPPPPPTNLHEWYFAANGVDSNNCHSTTTPCQTIGKFNGLTLVPGDKVFWRGGDSFAGTPMITRTQVPSKGDKNNPIVIDSYGTGKATILANNPGVIGASLGPKSFGVLIDAVSGITWQNINVSANGTPTQFGIMVQNSLGAIAEPADTITVQGNDVSGFHLPTGQATSDFSAEIFITGWAYPPGGTPVCGNLANIKVLNNSVHGVNGVTSLDDNGITGQDCRNIFNATYSGNTVFNLGGHAGSNGNGIIFIGVNGGLAERNLVHDIAANTGACGGPVGIWTYHSDSIVLQLNEVHHVHPLTWVDGSCDYGAFDADSGSTNITIQYNYGHHNDGPCVLVYGGEGLPHGPTIIRYNICVENALTLNDGGGEISMPTPGVVQVYNNTFFKSFHKDPASFPPSCWSGSWNGIAPAVGSVWANNICYTTATDQYGRSSYNMPTGNPMGNVYLGTSHNLWFANGYDRWQAPTGEVATLAAWQAGIGNKDAGAIVADPKLVNPASGAVGFKLQAGSPALGAGVDLTLPPFSLNVGTRDYFGNPISKNIGADAGAH